MGEARPSGGADHAVLDDGWSLWRTVGLRGTGFPIATLETLADPDLGRQVTDWLGATSARESILREAKAHVSCRLRAGAGDLRPDYRRAARRLRKGAIPDGVPEDAELCAILVRLCAAQVRERAAETPLAAMIGEAADRSDAALRRLAGSSRFREAVAWQNRHALETGVEPYLRDGASPSKANKRRLLVARYAQRYASKNETIGFFGPLAWAQLMDDGPTADVRPGTALLEMRLLRFEAWAVAALADALWADPAVQACVPPRLSPLVRLVPAEAGAEVHGNYGRRARVSAAELAFLRLCDGRRSAAEVVSAAGTERRCGPLPAAVAAKLLERFVRVGVLVWGLHPPPGPGDFAFLQGFAAGIPDRLTRKRVLDRLRAWDDARCALAAAAGDPDGVVARLHDLESRFRRDTGRDPRRQEGEAYAGRTLVYEDCRRDLDARFGPGLWREIGPPLSLMLDSARWFAARHANRYAERLKARFGAMCRQADRTEIDLDVFWSALSADNAAADQDAAASTIELQSRWTAILPAGPGPISLRSSEIADRVRAAFAGDPSPAWGAVHHSPDLMIAAHSVEALNAGQWLAVLGELHAGGNTLLAPAILDLHPDPDRFVKACAADQGGTVVRPVRSRRRLSQRVIVDPPVPGDLHMQYDGSASWRPPQEVLRVADFVVRCTAEGRLVIAARDGSRAFCALAFFGGQQAIEVLRNFKPFATAEHRPRITIDRLVVRRESWSIAPATLDFATLADPVQRYLALRRWAHGLDLPRYSFVRVPGEPKPFLLDLDSTVLADLFCRFVRRVLRRTADMVAEPITLSEMLPDPAQCWLPDAAGNRYASELRLVAVDRRAADGGKAPTFWRPAPAA